MKVKIAIIIYTLIVSLVFGCNSENLNKTQSTNNKTYGVKSVYFLYDSKMPVLMQPKIDEVIKIMNSRGIDIKILDFAGKDYVAELIKIETQSISGLIISLAYNFTLDKYLEDTHSTKFTILQYGGDYYENDVSVSINSKYVGYLVGKKAGELFVEKGINSPKIGFCSIESERNNFERGFIEGMGEVVPDAYISRRQIVSMSGETIFVSGYKDIIKLDGIVVFFCDSYAKSLLKYHDILKIRVGEELHNMQLDGLEISLSMKKEKKVEESINQFAEMLNGNQTNMSEFKYNAVFDFVIS